MLVVEKTAEMNQYGFDILVISECKDDYKHELAKPSYTQIGMTMHIIVEWQFSCQRRLLDP